MKALTVDALRKRRATTIADLGSKVEAEDWHGVADAAMDLREIDAAMEGIASVLSAASIDAFADQAVRDYFADVPARER